MEEWKIIEDYPNYMVSNMGRVKSLNYNRTGKDKILKGGKNNKGYLQIKLWKEGKRKFFLVHRLVAEAFIPNPNNYPIINHRDENPKNNSVDNLEWCSREYNNNYGTHNEKVAKSLSIPILQFTKEGEFLKKWDGLIEVERELGINRGNIWSCLKGKYKTAGGYVWGYKKDYERIPFKVFDLEIYKKIA